MSVAVITVFLYIFVFLFGIVIGSFLNVCIYRIPLKESIVFPHSHCMTCGYQLRWYDLVQLFISKGQMQEVSHKVIASVSLSGRHEWSIICDRFLGERLELYECRILSPDIRPYCFKCPRFPDYGDCGWYQSFYLIAGDCSYIA